MVHHRLTVDAQWFISVHHPSVLGPGCFSVKNPHSVHHATKLRVNQMNVIDLNAVLLNQQNEDLPGRGVGVGGLLLRRAPAKESSC